MKNTSKTKKKLVKPSAKQAKLDAEKDKELEEWSKEYEAIKNYKLIEEIVDHD